MNGFVIQFKSNIIRIKIQMCSFAHSEPILCLPATLMFVPNSTWSRSELRVSLTRAKKTIYFWEKISKNNRDYGCCRKLSKHFNIGKKYIFSTNKVMTNKEQSDKLKVESTQALQSISWKLLIRFWWNLHCYKSESEPIKNATTRL